ncbi:DNA-binding LacI/PurR family transcriptional regulator [Pseudoclavibacter chungangensis]|nr:DNA-binding LacI/PurR family transcriptional regulator [Pseudoclavibacter chungangensis]
MSIAGGRAAVRERLESGSRFTAVFTHNDLAALDGL